MKKSLAQRQAHFLSDHESGASQITEQFLNLSEQSLRANKSYDAKVFRSWIEQCQRAHPSMGGLQDSAQRIARRATDGRDVLLEILRLERQRLQDLRHSAARTAAQWLGTRSTIVTLSQSSLVLETLRLHALEGPVRVLLCESRPLMEGRQMARQLVRFRIPVDLFVDAAAPTMVAEADVALVGADTIQPDGGILNKVGSLALALACRHRQIPFVVVAESTKRADNPLRIERQNPREVWSRPLRGVRVLNRYFESVPGELVTLLCTDLGALTPTQWKRLKGTRSKGQRK